MNMNKKGKKFVLITNKVNQLIGVMSDGDIRRALLEGTLIDASVLEVSNDSFVSLPINTPLIEIQKKLNDVLIKYQ